MNGRPGGERLGESMRSVLPSVITALPAFLPQQRWYGAKERTIERVEVRDWAAIPDHAGTLLAIVDVFDGGDAPTTYFLPLGLWAADDASAPGAVIVRADEVAVRDAIADLDTCRALLRGILEGRSLASERGGGFVFQVIRAGDERLSHLRASSESLTVRHANVEQSNSSVIFGDQVILKALRRLAVGIHPEIEVCRFLAECTRFDRIPTMYGWAEYRGPDGSVAPVAMLQRFVPNQGDGWSYLLARVAALQEQPSGSARIADEIAALGRTLGELHLALDSVSDDPAFAPEVISPRDLAEWRERTQADLDNAVARIERALADSTSAGRWSEDARALGRQVVAGAAKLRGAIAGITGLADGRAVKTRHHGDFHLGQTLAGADGWYVIDFEGEPARSLDERRAKQTPLRDVAGLLRSLDYARATVDRRGVTGIDPALFDTLRQDFLAGYLETVRTADPPILPGDGGALTAALLALETEKAVYELGYELGNRPDWVGIPLRALAQMAQAT